MHFMDEKFVARREKVYAQMEDRSMLILFTGQAPQRSGDQDYAYTPDRSCWYLTGVEEPQYVFLAVKLDGKVTEQWFIPRPEERQQIFYGHMPTEDEIAEQMGCPVAYHDRLEPTVDGLLVKNHMKYLWLDLERRSLSEPSGAANVLARRITKAHPYLSVVNAGALIGDMRRVKEPCEIADMKEAIRITGLGIESILAHMGPGVNERELQAWFEFTIKTNGAQENAFAPIVAAGERIPPEAAEAFRYYGVESVDCVSDI